MRLTGLIGLSVVALGPSLTAQAPVITPDGDPSVDSDTIYALHVDPADYPDEPAVVLLDDGVVRREADGRGTETYRTVVQVLRRDAVGNWSEYSFSWPEGQESFRLNWMRVLDLEGNVLSEEPSQQQETTVPAAEQYPVYVDTRVLRASLARVEPGTIIDYSYTRETIDPILEGDFYSSWLVNPGTPVLRSRLILDVPAEMEPRIVEENLDFARAEEVVHDRRVFTWVTADVPGFEPEPFAGYPNDVSMSIAYSGETTWDDVAAWYVELARDRFEAAPEAVAAAQPFVAEARTLDDSLRAVYRWIAQDIRYVSLSLGMGGYQPRPPLDVVETRFGDCKDKATLFLALARRFGVTVHPVLVALSGTPDSLHPSFRQFDHMIAAIETPDGYQYVDLTAELVPYDEMPPYLEGEIGVLVRRDATAEIVTFPETAPEESLTEIRITGELDGDGSFAGRMEMRTLGSSQYSLRDAMSESTTLTSTERERFARNIANSLFEGATADSLELFDGRDLAAEPRLTLDLRAPDVTSRSGSAHILPLPLPTYYSRSLIADLASRDERRFPIDVAEVNSPSVETYVMEFKLPVGWQAELPVAV
ncbi:MAG: DUF3857 domain-containing protein, partial [Gemmatimonadales bacterium]